MEYTMIEIRKRIHAAAFKLALTAVFAVMTGIGEVRAQNCADFTQSEFTKVPLVTGLSSPLKLAIMANGDILFIQRNGFVRLLKKGATAHSQALQLTVPGGSSNEDGLLGIALDPNFATNNYVYLYWTPTSPMSYRLSRYTFNGATLGAEKTVLTVPHAFGSYGGLVIHGAGAIAFDPSGNLLISTGDLMITNGGFAVPVNDGTQNFDAQRTSANTNNLLGKILRIKPTEAGYDIPAGNLFPAGTASTKPEIYAMGVRNPFTLTIDPKTGWAYSGEVGPDGSGAPIASQDEVNQIKAAGNFGWPYLTGNNQAYSSMSGTRYNPTALVNNSRNNNGATNLPPGVSALFYMGNGSSWPVTGITPKGGNRCIKVGGFYRFNPAGTNAKRLPPYFDNGFFMANHNDGEPLRFFKLNDAGGLATVRTFINSMARPISFEIGPDGSLYTMEWGSDAGHWFNGNNGILSRIDYSGNCSTTGVVHDFSKKTQAARWIRMVSPGHRVAFPEGATRVDLYDMKGTKRWSASANGAPQVVVPADVEAGLMYLKFSAN